MDADRGKSMTKDEVNVVSKNILGAAYKVCNTLGGGFF